MSIEAMRQALEALQGGYGDTKSWHKAIESAIKALRTAIQQAQQPATTEPVYWEWRHLSTHPDTVDFGQWSKWQRVEARSAIYTADDALAEFRAYIAQGYKYELRALYDHPAPSAAVTPEPVKSFAELREKHRAGIDAECAKLDATGEPVHQIRKAFTQDAEWAWRDATEALFHMHPKEHRRILHTHPAPNVPADVVREAERYRWLREQNESLESFTFYVGCDNVPDDDGSVAWVGADLDAAIDAAMLAANTHPAPSVLKDDQIAALVNKVRDIARMFHDHQSLRERIAIELVPALKVTQEVKSDAERGRFLIKWLKRYGLLQAEFGQIGAGEKPENWWLLHAPWGIDQTRPFLGHGKTPEQAIDAAMQPNHNN